MSQHGEHAQDNSSGPTSDVLGRLTRALQQRNVAYVHTQHRPVYTSAEAAEVRGAPLHSGAKALILKAGGRFVMVVLPADRSLDSGEVRRHLDCKRLRFASEDEVLRLTGLTPGSIPPFGSLFDLPTICDERLSKNELINFNAGTHTDSFQLTYAAYVGYESPAIAQVAR